VLGGDPLEASSSRREHHTASEAFAVVDRFAELAEGTGAPYDAIELVVLDANDERVIRSLLQ